MLNQYDFFFFTINKLQHAITFAGRIVIGLYGQVVPKTVGTSLVLYFCICIF